MINVHSLASAQRRTPSASAEALNDPHGRDTAGSQPLHQARLRDILRSYLRLADEELLARIEPELSLRRLAAGEILFRKGEPAGDIFFVVSGRLRAVHANAAGQDSVLGEIARGETVGELAVMTGETRMASVVAVRESVVASMSQTTFERVLATRPHMGLAMMRTVVERFRRGQSVRKPAAKPVNICLLPVTVSIDVHGFAARFAALWQDYKGPVRTLRRGDFDAAFPRGGGGAARDPHAVAEWLAAAEAENAGVLLVADEADPGWTQQCIQHADEIFLLARGDADPKISAVEARCLDAGTPQPIATQTLVLLHGEHTQSPTGTARWLDRRPVARHIHVRPALERDMRRLARIAAGRAVGIVLSGGGARGFAHVGVLNALAEAGIEPDFIGGTSVGAIVAAFRAADVRGEALVAAGRRVFVEQGNPTGDYNVLPLVSLLKGGRTRRITEGAVKETAGADIDVEDTWITCYCVAGNYSTSAETVLTRGRLAKAVLASYAIPGALPPVPIDGHLFVDGGTVNNLPVDVMERYGAETIIAVDLLSDAVRKVEVDWMPSTAALLIDRLRPKARRRYRLPGLPEMLFNATVLQSAGRQKEMRARADICIRPALKGVRLLDWRKYDGVVRSGYDSARAQLAAADAEVMARLR
jgi:NTE family protein